MKNPNILKDELRILKTDKSSVLTELRERSKELKSVQDEIISSNIELADVKTEIEKAQARYDKLVDRAFLLKKDLGEKKQDLNTVSIKLDAFRVKNSHQQKLHLGRIKELKAEEEKLELRLTELKENYDANSTKFSLRLSELKKNVRDKIDEIKKLNVIEKELNDSITKIRNEEKKLTKDRLKREDKIRERERLLEMKETGLKKREEDVDAMVKDVTIIYHRLKEMYAEVDPSVDIDKLITIAQ
jgi:DNA repair exonuclease SbcCD ATPase subunit